MTRRNPNRALSLSPYFCYFLTLLLAFGPVTGSLARSEAGSSVAASTAGQDFQSGDDLSPSAVFTNPTAINPPDDGVTGVTSTIAVAGLVGPISSVTVTLNNYTVPRPQQVDFLLVGPGGQKLILMSDVAGTGPASQTNNINLTLSDAGATTIPQSGALVSGVFRPTDHDASVNFPTSAPPYQSPAPLGGATFNTVFGGLSGGSVNGNWVLHVFDSSSGSGASTVAGGWSIDIVTTPAASATTTSLASSANPSFTNQAITLTSTTTSTSTVSTGVVDFFDNTTATLLCNDVIVNASGQAACIVPANTLTERIHNITATYVGNATFATSNGSINQSVNTPTQVAGTAFTNPGTIVIGDTGGASTVPYPSNIFVSGLSGTISNVTVSFLGVNFPETGDLDFLLVGPGGQKYVFWSDAGGGSSLSTGTFILSDAGVTQLPASGSIAAGTYRPADYAVESDVFPAPAPAGPYSLAAPAGASTFASIFGGAAPNGTWSLYATDDSGSGGITSSIAGWRLTFTTTGDAPTTTVVSGSPNPSTTTQAVVFTATVTSTSTVNSGTVTFRLGATVLCANVAVNASGVATCNVAAGTLPQGTHTITADYNGSPGVFNISSGTTTQQVNSPTVVTCLNFANNGGITVSNTTTLGNPYPSNILVSGIGGSIAKVTLTMNIGNAPTPEHNDFLLVGPGGQKFLFMGDAGGTTDIINQTITLDDAAASALPDTTAIVTGTYRPASYSGDTDIFPAPAPAAPYNPAATEGVGTFASIFNGSSPNGTWSLYATEDAGDAANTVINNWSLTFTLAAAATTTSVTSSADPSVFGQPVTFTATVATAGLGTPTGNVQFFDGATPIGGPIALNASGQATFMTSTLAVGSHTISAQYAGAAAACTGTFNSSTGSMTGNPQVVNQASTTTSITSNQANPVGVGIPVTFTATVSPVAPGAGTRTGTVTFNRNGFPVCTNVAVNASGQATCTITFTIAGSYNITAAYSGDTNFTASASATFVQQAAGPTAANVGISGRVIDRNGRGVSAAQVAIVDQQGVTRWAVTNPFGYYRFAEVPSGQSYLVSVAHKRFAFQTRTLNVTDDLTNVDFVAEPGSLLNGPERSKGSTDPSP